MSFAATTHRRGLKRSTAILSAIAVFMSLMVMFAPTALAHHPEISANQTCVDKQVRIAYESVSWKTDGTPGSGHSDIRIEVQRNGAGPWIEVASGAFNAGNNFRFSGTFDASSYWGDNLVVRARANGAWDNGVGGGETRATSQFLVTQDCFNPSCPDQYLEYKVDPVSAGQHGSSFTISNIQDGGSGPTFDWSSTKPVFRVIVKGGPGANLYDYPGGDTSHSGLHAPQNPKNGKWYGLSHITFCYGEPEPEPDPVAVTPTPQVCEAIQGAAQGAVLFNIDPAAGATVQVYSDAGHTNPIGGVLGDDQTLNLPPGTYYWLATATNGDFELTGDTSGQFTIDPCSSSVVVVGDDCAVNSNGAPLGGVTVTIDPTSGATVEITGPGGPYDFSGSGGSQELAPGTYDWTATAASGYALTGVTSGRFTIDPCEATVSVTGECHLDGNFGSGLLEVEISTPGAMTVEILDGGTVVGKLSSSGILTVAEGRTYSWTATAAIGYEIDGDDEGTVVIDACSLSLSISVAGVCENDVPILRWTVTPLNLSATETTITWLDIDPANPLRSSVQPLSGEMVWPGAVVGNGKAVDWPGWVYVDKVTKQPISLGTAGGTWLQGSDGYEDTRPTTMIRFDVNPTAVVEVDYPGGEPTCAGPDEVLGEVIDNPVVVDDEVKAVEVLPFTGVDTELLLAASVVLLGSGLFMVRKARRWEQE